MLARLLLVLIALLWAGPALAHMAVSVSAGAEHTCAATAQGKVLCWGANDRGQLGDGTTVDRDAPVLVTGVSNVAEVASGDSFSCARTTAGAVLCWGGNHVGQLGDGTTTDRLAPVPVTGLASGAASLDLGNHHACVVTSSGTASCWGLNDLGQLGNGTTASSAVPVPVSGSSGVSQISAASSFTCALAGGAAYCWGFNLHGLGNGTESSTVPAPVTGLESGVLSIATGGFFHPEGRACAVRQGGELVCWGHGSYDGIDGGSPTPEPVDGFESGVASIALGWEVAAVSMASGAVLGNGRSWPTTGWRVATTGDGGFQPIPDLPGGALQVSAGRSHACAVIPGGGVRCWGNDLEGQVGDGPDPAPSATPLPVVGLESGVTEIAAGASDPDQARSCAIANGEAWCWGSTWLGDGLYPPSHLPVKVSALDPGVSGISDADGVSCVLTADGHPSCWGENSAGFSAPSPASFEATAASAGGQHYCAVTTAGGVTCVGWEWLLDGEGFPYFSGWTHSPYAGGMVGVAPAPQTCGLSSAGAVSCWQRHQAPVAVPGLESGIAAIAGGYDHACALTQSGGVLCWGSNQHGKRGGSTFVPGTSLVQVTGLTSGAVAISAGRHHTCALMSDDSVRCWGQNADLQLGVESPSQSTTPVTASIPAATAIAAGASHTCAVTPEGAAVCWGANLQGQRGDGTDALHGTPVPVVSFGGAEVPALPGVWLLLAAGALLALEARRRAA